MRNRVRFRILKSQVVITKAQKHAAQHIKCLKLTHVRVK